MKLLQAGFITYKLFSLLKLGLSHREFGYQLSVTCPIRGNLFTKRCNDNASERIQYAVKCVCETQKWFFIIIFFQKYTLLAQF